MTLHFDALRITQPSGRYVYAFAATAEVILQIAEIQRISRDEADELVGYQRPEVMSHIVEIRRYIEGSDAVLPNTIVIAFDDSVQFTPYDSARKNGPGEFGTLDVPENTKDVSRPGFIVDGQQRLAAMVSCAHSNFPIFVTAMIAPDIREQRKQFVLVNRTKPLPKGMIFELLPEIDGVLPYHLAKQQLAASITTQLNLKPYSFLYRKIKTPTCPQGRIKDNSIRRLVLNSLSDGILYTVSQEGMKQAEFVERAIQIVSTFWEGVTLTFGHACDLPPTQSRLTHGVGIAAMGYVMDHIYSTQLNHSNCTADTITNALEPLKKICAWTEGFWDFGDRGIRPWNDLQNIGRDIRLLTNYLLRGLKNSRRQ